MELAVANDSTAEKVEVTPANRQKWLFWPLNIRNSSVCFDWAFWIGLCCCRREKPVIEHTLDNLIGDDAELMVNGYEELSVWDMPFGTEE